MVRLSELSVKYLPCPVHKRAPPNPLTIEIAYKTQALGSKNEAINALEEKKTKKYLKFINYNLG